jgi:diadenosine tetraphosphatase ApaH/serine/threonine PP2A family protein phosphatase
MLALLYDVHGNLPALDAVLEDAQAAGADTFLLGGDYTAFGGWPVECVARLDELEPASWLRGNWDRWLGDFSALPDDEAIRGAADACAAVLDGELIARLATLPETIERDGTLYCHASPPSDLRSFLPVEQPEDGELLTGVTARRVVFGHTHLQFSRTTAEGIELVNPGSIGLPLDGDRRAAYAVVAPDGAIELRRVPYDHEAAAARLLERFGESPWTRLTAARLREARFDAG